MPSPSRYPSGVSTAAKGSTLFNLPAQDPTKVHMYWQDFITYVAADFTKTVIGTGDAAAVADDPFGAIALTNSAADNDGVQLQLPVETFTLAAGKKAWFKARVKVSDATESDLIFGLAVLDTTLLGATAGDGVTDGIFFQKDDGSTTVSLCCQKDATTGQKTVSVGAATTAYQTWGFEYDGVSTIKAFKDDVHVASMDITSTPTAFLPDTPVTVSVGILNGAAAAKSLTVDYLFAAIER